MNVRRMARPALAALFAGAAFFAGAIPRLATAADVETLSPNGALAPQRVLIDGAQKLDGYLYQPKADGRPHPAVVMAHGCGGVLTKDGKFSERYRQWGELLAAQGYVALLVDSFSTRGIREICTQTRKIRPLHLSDRVQDVRAGRDFLAARADVDPQRIALLGWSNGGSTTLLATGETPAGANPFTAAVAFYPACAPYLRQHYKPQSPLLVLIGEADDWTPAEPCHRLAEATPEMRLLTYPGAYHGFDAPSGKLRKRLDVPNGVKPGAGVTMGPNPEARADALPRVLAFLAEHLP